MIRQSLDADSAYVDVALHGDGLTSLQFRETKGAATHEVQANVVKPGRLRIEKRGNYVTMWLGDGGRAAGLLGRGGADHVRGAVLRRPRRLRPRPRGDRRRPSSRTSRSRRPCPPRRARRSSIARWRLRPSPRPTAGSSTSRPTRIEAPNWLPGRQDAGRQRRGPTPEDPRHRRDARTDRHGVRRPLQQRPWGLARRVDARHQRPVAGESPVINLYLADRRGHPQARSPRPARPTGTAGRPTARPWPSAASAGASLTSTRSRPSGARRSG